jgi:hypothetical protein
MTAQLIKCTCSHDEQDRLYGKGVRVGNETRSSQYRCTVCGTLIGTKTVATAKAPVITAETPTKADEKKAGADNAKSKKASSGSGKTTSKSGGSKDIKKEPKKKSLKGTKR